MKVLDVKNISKSFGKTLAVDGISFTLSKGEVLGFLGPNGAGKSTTIKCIMDFIRPDSGLIKVFGKNSVGSASEIMQDVGYLPAEVKLYENWTGYDHIELVQKIRQKKCRDDVLISELDFDPKKKVKTLSTGNKQKLGLILAMMHNPKLLILDEPTTGLDPFFQQKVCELLAQHAEAGNSVFMSSHNLAEVERVCNRVLILKDGKIIEQEQVSQLKKKKVFTVFVYFDAKLPSVSEFDSKNIKIVRKIDNGYHMVVKGDIDRLIRQFVKYKVRDLEIVHASLEDLFLEYYEE